MRSSNVHITNQNDSQNNVLKINSSNKPIELQCVIFYPVKTQDYETRIINIIL